ncbi:MAG: tetratricopeptide repeat protein [Acidobacteria bacterium]|nr:tetratricopeptide repeat protein [Acidobacteriota bacterium]
MSRHPRDMCVAVFILIAAAMPSWVWAQPGRAAVASGNRLYEEGRFDEAHEQYLEALRQAPDSPVVPFNDGNALYRTEAFERAMDAYQKAAESGDPRVAASAWYNLGNALYNQQQLEPALEAYKQALRRNPSDTDAKHNLEVTLEQLQEQQQNQDQNQDQNQSDPQQGEGQENEPPEQNEPGDQDEPQDQSQASPDEGEQPQDQPEPGDQSEPQPGELSREEAERLLQAINEDPGEIQRQRRSTTPVRPPRRPW